MENTYMIIKCRIGNHHRLLADLDFRIARVLLVSHSERHQNPFTLKRACTTKPSHKWLSSIA